MERILAFLIERGSFLCADNRYRFVDSWVMPGRKGEASLVLASPVMRIRIVLDTFQLFLECQPSAPSDEWFSVDLIWRYLRGERRDTAVMDDANIEFVADNLDAIEAVFRDDDGLEDRLNVLRHLKQVRAEERYGPLRSGREAEPTGSQGRERLLARRIGVLRGWVGRWW